MEAFELITNREKIESLSSQMKKYVRGMEDPFAFILNGKVIAKGELVIHEDQSLEIKMLESVEKRTGAGRLFVKYLKNLPMLSGIWGEALPEAVGFWFKVGAKFEPTSFEEYMNTEQHEEGFLVPFTIRC